MKNRRKGSRSGKRRRGSTRPFTLEFKLRVVRLYLEEGYRRSLIAREFGISESSVGRWTGLYRKYGEQGLRPKARTATPVPPQWNFPGGRLYFISRRNGRTFPGPPP